MSDEHGKAFHRNKHYDDYYPNKGGACATVRCYLTPCTCLAFSPSPVLLLLSLLARSCLNDWYYLPIVSIF